MSDLRALVIEFADAVMDQKEAIRSGDARRGNRHANAYARAWDRLRKHGDRGRDALATLLNDDRADVRAMAACYLLRYRTQEAAQVLQEVATGEGLAAFGASEALERWAEGDWHLDPED
ncbi:MAG TPA: DUF2019 domain-containing protein [Phycisphaerae bacterium]|nr:DUF2019 domain-containing protein [Phycisphaerae bacterium]